MRFLIAREQLKDLPTTEITILTTDYDRSADALAIHLRTKARSARTARVPNILNASTIFDRKTLASLPTGTESLTLAEAWSGRSRNGRESAAWAMT